MIEINYGAPVGRGQSRAKGKGINGLEHQTKAFMPEAFARYSSPKPNFVQIINAD